MHTHDDSMTPFPISSSSGRHHSLDNNYPLLKSFLAGSFSGTCSTILFQPLDLIKTRIQDPERNAQRGMRATVSGILQQEQVKGLWRGVIPSIARCVPGVGLYFCSLDFLRTHLTTPTNNGLPTALESVLLGMCARCLTGVVLIPITVIKTRYESPIYGYASVGAALRHIYRTEGVRGLTCGLVPTLIRDAPFSGLYLLFYTKAKQRLLVTDALGQDDNCFTMSMMHFTCGLLAGSAAALVTQPFDVIKTRMQLQPNQWQSVRTTAVRIYRQEGMPGYFRGVVPRMLRRTLMAAMAWTVYERITLSIGLKL